MSGLVVVICVIVCLSVYIVLRDTTLDTEISFLVCSHGALTHRYFDHMFLFYNYRQRVPLHSERGTTSRTRRAVGVERYHTTFRKRLAPPVDTLPRKREATTGEQRPRVVVLLELDVCAT